MNELLHFIGLCPDNMYHPDMLSLFITGSEYPFLFSGTKLWQQIQKSAGSLINIKLF